MKKGELLKKAAKDFELARKYSEAKEYITASILYRTATEKVLRALFLKHMKKSPPVNASIEYLAKQTALPESIYEEVISIPDESIELMEEENLLEYDEDERTHLAQRSEYHSTLSKREAVKRLLDYAKANV
jgi:HEPN domain-containing protein